MPFQSEKQRRFLHANHPEIAKRWEKEYAYGGLLSLGNESIVDTTEEGNDISLVDDTSQGIERMFVKKGGRIGFRVGSGEGKDVSGREYGGGNVSASNPNEDRAREERSAPTPREVGIQQAYEEAARKSALSKTVTEGPGSPVEKYEDPLDEFLNVDLKNPETWTPRTVAGYRKRREAIDGESARNLKNAQDRVEKKLISKGKSRLIKLAVMLAFGLPAPAIFTKADLLDKDLIKGVIDITTSYNKHKKNLEETIEGYKTLGMTPYHHTVDTPLQTKEQEYLDLTQPRDDPDEFSKPAPLPVTDEIEESTTFAWDMLSPRYHQKLKAQRDDLIGEETSGLADLFTVKTQQ